jgi:hypothetical protein
MRRDLAVDVCVVRNDVESLSLTKDCIPTAEAATRAACVDARGAALRFAFELRLRLLPTVRRLQRGT